MKRELLQKCIRYMLDNGMRGGLIKEIEAELEKPKPNPEPEPAAYMIVKENGSFVIDFNYPNTEGWWPLGKTPLYTSPPQQKPLSENSINNICATLWSGGWRLKAMVDFARAIEKAHRIGE